MRCHYLDTITILKNFWQKSKTYTCNCAKIHKNYKFMAAANNDDIIY